MQIACFLFDGITALDIVGPYEVLQRLPDADVRFVAKQAGEIRTDNKFLALVADHASTTSRRPTSSSCPAASRHAGWRATPRRSTGSGPSTRTRTWTTSVCTGSMLLAAAGLLEGKEATSHWASLDRLADYGAIPTGRRVVEQGKYVTAAGVSSGIDMGLTLAARIAGDDFAQAVQLGIEYDPQPPFDAGSVDKAPDHIVELLAGMYAGRV